GTVRAAAATASRKHRDQRQDYRVQEGRCAGVDMSGRHRHETLPSMTPSVDGTESQSRHRSWTNISTYVDLRHGTKPKALGAYAFGAGSTRQTAPQVAIRLRAVADHGPQVRDAVSDSDASLRPWAAGVPVAGRCTTGASPASRLSPDGSGYGLRPRRCRSGRCRG